MKNQLSTFTNYTCILEMRAAQHAIWIRVLFTCQNGRFHPTAVKTGHQDWAWSLTKDSISCCNCTCGKNGIVELLRIAYKYVLSQTWWALTILCTCVWFTSYWSARASNHSLQSINLTFLKVSKLATHNTSIIWTPVGVTTNCSPCLINADFNPSFIRSGSIYQSNFTIRAIGKFSGNGCMYRMAQLPGFSLFICCYS